MNETQTIEAGISLPPPIGSDCECINWASENLTAQLLTGHHARCPHGGDQLTAALALIAELVKGIEQWASEEDGVYDGVWKAYQKAKALQGVFLSYDPNEGSKR